MPTRPTRLFARTRARFRTLRGGWRLADDGETHDVVERDVLLEIQGTRRGGYVLVMSPDGLGTADAWCGTSSDALDDAFELFGVPRDAWSDTPP